MLNYHKHKLYSNTMQNKDYLINKLSEKERFCLIAYLQTGNQIMAYICSRKKQTEANSEALKSMASRWINSEPVLAFLEAERGRKAVLMDEALQNRSKEDIIAELNKLASLSNDTKLKAEILMKVADLEGMKKQEAKREERLIHYYLPLMCSKCSLYTAAKAKKEREAANNS